MHSKFQEVTRRLKIHWLHVTSKASVNRHKKRNKKTWNREGSIANRGEVEEPRVREASCRNYQSEKRSGCMGSKMITLTGT